jgi:uncharacterized protein YjbI with pentapeptide repeats
MGITDIDFRGIVLRNFSFDQHDIVSLKGSRFSDGWWLSNSSRNNTVLENVDFSFVDCRNVTFSSSGIGGLTGVNLSFFNSRLSHANFEGATLTWTNTVRDEADWYSAESTEDGGQTYAVTYSPAFDGADLEGCSFKNVSFLSADFRGALNVGSADFSGAVGLDTCYFDAEVDRSCLGAAKPLNSG